MQLAADRPFKPLVIGAPRTGHILCQAVLLPLVQCFPDKRDLKQAVVDLFCDALGEHVAHAVDRITAKHGLQDDLMFNANFRHFLGGPKWIKEDDHSKFVARKYIGFRGKGDFTLLTSHPVNVFDQGPVAHSHETPDVWPGVRYFDSHIKFATIRNPVGTLNSSCFSINALTSEYIQRFMRPEEDNDQLRQDLAMYKLTDLDFFDGLAVFLKAYCDRFLKAADSYYHMRWEDLIDHPIPTIQRLGRHANLSINDDVATQMWNSIKGRNLAGNHKHNYRQGGGIVGGWKQWLTNHHLERIKGHGFEPFLERFGYGPIKMLDESRYNDFQKRVDAAIRRGEKPNPVEDDDLFGFAFNKSNLDSSKFAFKRYDWRVETRLERSSFADEALPLEVWDEAEAACARINRVLEAVIDSRWYEAGSAAASLTRIRKEFAGGFGHPDDAKFEQMCGFIAQLLERFFKPKSLIVQ